MPIVLLEGYDGVGKSTTIKKLKEKYNIIEHLAFPTFRPIVEYNKNNLQDILQHHYEFTEDFVNLQGLIKNKETLTLVLLDRYFYSNIVYLKYDLIKYFIKINTVEFRKLLDINKQIENLFYDFYKLLIQPDLVIWLEYYSVPSSKASDIEAFYSHAFKKLPPKNLEIIKALQPDTFLNIENILKHHGFIK